MDQEKSVRVPILRKIGYGLGDFGGNFYYTGLNLFLLYFYTDVVGISPAIAGLIFAIPLVWDAVTDPAMGYITTRFNTRFGRYRPYILFGAPPLALSFIAMFAAPLWCTAAPVAAAMISHIIFRTCLTIVAIPYSSLMAVMTPDTDERGALAGIRMICATIGGVTTAALTLTLAEVLGGGDLQTGFLWVSIIYAVAATILFLISFLSVKEDSSLAPPTAQMRFAEFAAFLKSNTALHILIAGIVFITMGSTIFGKSMVYYILYVAALDIEVSVLLTVLTLGAAISIPFWMWASKKAEKRTIWLIGAGIVCCTQIVLFFAPISIASVFLAFVAILGWGNGAFVLTFWSMLPDTVEYGEWKSGARSEGLVFGINAFALKFASAVGIGILGFLLELIGYVANQEQAASTRYGLQIISLGLPFVLVAASAVVMWFYPISKNRHRRLVRILDRGRLRTQGERQALS